VNHNYDERKILEENYKRFQRKEKMRELEEKGRTKNVMDFNQSQRKQKEDAVKRLEDMEKNQFNRQANEDHLYMN
jgi:CelD/BcsL family acetyltransferase involved in cellulose biosynthesis